MAAAFAADLLLPLGVAGGIPYAGFVLFSLRSSEPGAPIFAAVVSSGLTCLGYFLSPDAIAPVWAVIANRGIAMATIWVAALLCVARARREQEAQLTSRIISGMTEGVALISTAKAKIVFTNPKFEEIFGYAPGELLGMPVSMLNAPDDSPQAAADRIAQALYEHGSWHGELRNVRKDGTTFWTRANVSTLEHYRYGEVWLGLQQDITVRRRSEELLRDQRVHLENLVDERTRELKRSQGQLERAARIASIGTLAAGIAHEINNPLGLIQLGTDTALENLGSPELVERLLRGNKEEVERCALIVQSILRFARDQSSEKWPLDLSDVLRRTLDFVGSFAADRKVSIEADRMREVPVLGNRTELELVGVNLIHNAVAACEVGGKVRVSVDQLDGKAVLTIRDTGQGMTSDELDHAFEPFFTSRRHEGGTGLGLSTAHGIVVDHQGTIDIESESGAGTIVRIELPLLDDSGGGDGEYSRH